MQAPKRPVSKGKMLRVSEDVHAAVSRLAAALGKSHREIVEDAIAALERKRFLEEVAASYAALASNPEEMKAYQEELSAWDATLLDGLEQRHA